MNLACRAVCRQRVQKIESCMKAARQSCLISAGINVGCSVLFIVVFCLQQSEYPGSWVGIVPNALLLIASLLLILFHRYMIFIFGYITSLVLNLGVLLNEIFSYYLEQSMNVNYLEIMSLHVLWLTVCIVICLRWKSARIWPVMRPWVGVGVGSARAERVAHSRHLKSGHLPPKKH